MLRAGNTDAVPEEGMLLVHAELVEASRLRRGGRQQVRQVLHVLGVHWPVRRQVRQILRRRRRPQGLLRFPQQAVIGNVEGHPASEI